MCPEMVRSTVGKIRCWLQSAAAKLYLPSMEVTTRTGLPLREGAVQGWKVHSPHSCVEEGVSSTCARCALMESGSRWRSCRRKSARCTTVGMGNKK